jgi:hypothetical protein
MHGALAGKDGKISNLATKTEDAVTTSPIAVIQYCDY